MHKKSNPFLSEIFKIWILSFIVFVIFFHIFLIFRYPLADSSIFDNLQKVLLGLVLIFTVYLWIQEVRDRHRLQSLNEALIQAHAQLEDAEVDTMGVLVLTEEAKDPYVKGHSSRVAKISCDLAREMELPSGRQKIIERAGKLHDIGKIGIVDAVLNKKGKLNDEEWEIIKKHPRQAVEILKPLRFLSIEKGIILHHHERYDGRGYPDGLMGKAIPMEARIMSVADTFDAMNSARAYRNALSREEIIEELSRVAGSQLDPVVVESFLSLLQQNPYLWERE